MSATLAALGPTCSAFVASMEVMGTMNWVMTSLFRGGIDHDAQYLAGIALVFFKRFGRAVERVTCRYKVGNVDFPAGDQIDRRRHVVIGQCARADDANFLVVHRKSRKPRAAF